MLLIFTAINPDMANAGERYRHNYSHQRHLNHQGVLRHPYPEAKRKYYNRYIRRHDFVYRNNNHYNRHYRPGKIVYWGFVIR